jgi:signal transduction histidine kinase
MDWMLYLRLVVLTAGTLLPFFWMIVILGHRRQRNFECVFFFLCLAITLFFGSSLLALNARLFYAVPPSSLLTFSWTTLCVGLWFIPPLLVHLHIEYASIRERLASSSRKLSWLLIAWVPAILLTPELLSALRDTRVQRFESPSEHIGSWFQGWLVVAVLLSAYWQWKFSSTAPDEEQRKFHRGIQFNLCLMAAFIFLLIAFQRTHTLGSPEIFSLCVMLIGLFPLAALISNVQRFNFLQIGRQRNLIYAVFIVFLALLYVSFVRRASLWLEPHLPPEATAALLLFLPVVFFEPLQRVMRGLLRQTAQAEVDRAQRLMSPINEAARLGDMQRLIQFAEGWTAEQLQLAEVQISLDSEDNSHASSVARQGSWQDFFDIRRGAKVMGLMKVRSHGAMISGETYAGLELVAEQLPAAFDLCRLIEEKLQLERELAERERLALVGQMAASISHNLKNPLGSIKTILQVQMEGTELPSSLRAETQMVLDEINRLSSRLNQLLQFSRPGARSGDQKGPCDIARVAESVVAMFRHEAEHRGIALELCGVRGSCPAAIGEEAASDILSNVVLNAIEAATERCDVRLDLHRDSASCAIQVQDDGAGIPASQMEKVREPFFTTKARGTGLGLAIVDRRLEEIGGELQIESPVRDGRGTIVRMIFPRAEGA